MIGLQVDVVFRSLTVVGGSTVGDAIPVASFILNGCEYEINLSADLVPIGNPGGGQIARYLVDENGYKWKITSNDTNNLVSEVDSQVGGPRTFWVMYDEDNNVCFIGINTSGGFEPKYFN
jgi:hypothetical protein